MARIKATGKIDFFLPKKTCQYCMFLKYEEAYRRYSCRLSGEWLLAPFDKVGDYCRLSFEGEDEYGI